MDSDQEVCTFGDGRILLTFTASFEPEVIGWVLSLGEQARLAKPLRLRRKLGATISAMSEAHNSVS